MSFMFSFVNILQKQPPEVFCKKGVLINFTKFTGKHLCQGLFLIKLQALGLRYTKHVINKYVTPNLLKYFTGLPQEKTYLKD